MLRLIVDKIASTAALCSLSHQVALSSYVIAEEGYCVAVRALEEKSSYNHLECIDGTFETIEAGDLLVGVLGERQALRGYSGRIPRAIHPGDVLHVLNLGGIIGLCTSDHPSLGPALKVEVLGAVLIETAGRTSHARIQDHALEPVYRLRHSAPLVVVSGTAMHTGKTMAACRIIEGLTLRGLRVAAAKLTGAALLRDVRMMEEHGAIAGVTFTKAGVVASTNKEMGPPAKALVAHLNTFEPDIIVLELGDGFIGYYGVDGLLLDKELQRFAMAHVVAANDLAGVWAADHLFRQRYRAPIAVVTGPVTDNAVGIQYIQNALGIPACNAQQEPERLADLVSHALQASSSDHKLFYPSGIAL
ncbi:MAG: hypothetical protein ACE5G0_12740 [Rhodothermales bacterium]